MERAIAMRAKAMKCLTQIVESDPVVLIAQNNMQLGVNHSFLNQNTAVREGAVDLVGKFVLFRPELIDKYYEMLSVRILDTGVSVRKRFIKVSEYLVCNYLHFSLRSLQFLDNERHMHRMSRFTHDFRNLCKNDPAD